jgi:hypothetical protein
VGPEVPNDPPEIDIDIGQDEDIHACDLNLSHGRPGFSHFFRPIERVRGAKGLTHGLSQRIQGLCLQLGVLRSLGLLSWDDAM